MNKIASLILNFNQTCTFPMQALIIHCCKMPTALAHVSILLIYITDKELLQVSVTLNTRIQRARYHSPPFSLLLAGEALARETKGLSLAPPNSESSALFNN